MTLERGTRVGPYAIEALLGMGGMGAVYRARDTRLGRVVALKVVRPGRVDRTGVDPSDRLLAEAQAAAALRHRNIVEVYDAGVVDGQTYVAMEYVEGKPLRAYVGDPSVSLDGRLRWLREAAGALGAAHQAGLVHRDVKPENVMVDAEGRARVLDFGIAKRFAFDTSAPTAERAVHLETAEGRVIGTAAYMAPEQLAGGAPDPKWDQFAWGVMAYELLTGVHPRQAVPMPGATAHFTQTPRLPSEVVPGLPFEVGASVLRAIAPDAARRFASMVEAAEAMQPSPTSSRTRDRVAAPAPLVAPPPPRAAIDPAQAASARSRSRWPLVVAALLVVVGATAIAASVVALVEESRPPPPPPSAEPAAAAKADVDAGTAPVASTPVPTEEVRTASVDAAPPASGKAPSASGKTPSTKVPGTCACIGDGRLCPLTASRDARACNCFDSEGFMLAQRSDDWQNSLKHRGRGLTDGQSCVGHNSTGGPQVAGTLRNCLLDCETRAFSGSERSPCRGLNRMSAAEETGFLQCYF